MYWLYQQDTASINVLCAEVRVLLDGTMILSKCA